MKMNEVKSAKWSKAVLNGMTGIPTDDFSIDGIASAISKIFGEQMFEDILEAIADGYIEICDDGIIVWCS